MACDEFESPLRLDGEDRAVIPTRQRMREPAGLSRVEEENMVGIGQACLTSPGASEHAPAHQNDTVSCVRLFGTIRLDVCAATEIHNRNAKGFEEQFAL